MQPKRYVLAILSLCLALTGCSKSAKAPSSDNQAAASQSNAAADTNAAPDSGASNQPFATPAPQPLVIPAGTSITVRLQERLSSASAVRGERFDAVIDEPVVVGDQVVVPVGALATGHVVVAHHSGRLHHPGELGLALDSVTVGQQNIPLATSSVVARGRSHKKRNWTLIGGGTGGGALIGALAAGGKGTLIGSAIGAAAGTTTAFVTGKKDVMFGSERRLRFRLDHDVAVSG
jgi:hypothetical protein